MGKKRAASEAASTGFGVRVLQVDPRQDYGWAGPAATALDDARQARLAEIVARVEGHLSGHRLRHSLSVAETARRIARAHGVDEFVACAAGLLHDWDKHLSADELWEKARRVGLGLSARDDRVTPVLHGMTAAATLPQEFDDLPPEAFQAIARHTVGAEGMSALDIVIYCADMLEPLRGPDLDALRSRAADPLDVLFAACLQQNLLYLVKRHRYVYPPCVDVWNAYADRLDAPAAAGGAR